MRSKKQRDWTPRNAVLLPPFLMEAAILHGESDTGKILNIFAHSISGWEKEEETTSEADEDNEENSVITIEAEDAKLANPGKANQASAKTLTTTTDYFDNILDFLQDVAAKYPQVIAAPLSLYADKRARLVPTLDIR